MRDRVVRTMRSPEARDGLLTVALFVASVAPLLLAPVRARLLGPEDRGAFAMFQASFALVAAFSMLGVRHAAYGAGLPVARRPPLALAAWSLLAATLLAAPLAVVAHLRDQTAVAVILLGCVVLAPGWMLFQLEVASTSLRRRRKELACLIGAPPLVDLVVTGVLVLLRSLSLTATIVVAVLAELVRIAIAVVILRRRRGEASGGTTPSTFVRSALARTPASVLPQMSMHVDVLVFAATVPLSVLGVYAVSRIGYMLLTPVSIALEGRAIALGAEHGTPRAVLFSLLVCGAAFLTMAPGGAWLIPFVFGEAFAAAAPAFVVMCAAGAVRCAGQLISAHSAARGHVAPASIGAAVHAVVAVMTAFFVVALPGDPTATGMALATLAAQGAGSLALLISLNLRKQPQ